jgi:outer membrane biosynthesis protein TonB
MRRDAEELYPLRVTSAVVLGGAVVTKGSVIEVDEAVAKDLLRRGKAEVATLEDAKPTAAKPAEPLPQDAEQQPAEPLPQDAEQQPAEPLPQDAEQQPAADSSDTEPEAEPTPAEEPEKPSKAKKSKAK